MPTQILVSWAEIFSEKTEIFSMLKSKIFSFLSICLLGLVGLYSRKRLGLDVAIFRVASARTVAEERK